MINKEIEELYKSGEWICVWKYKDTELNQKWRKDISKKICFLNTAIDYKLIHKKHKHILDAYLDGCEVYRYYDPCDDGYVGKWDTCDFIEYYHESAAYEAIPTSLDNCYCDCTKSHKQKIEGLTTFRYNMSTAYYENGFRDKKIQYNTQLENWVYCPYDNTTINHTKKESCNICGESKENCPSEETCSYKIEFNDTKREEMENKETNIFNCLGFETIYDKDIDFVYKDNQDIIHGRIIETNDSIRWNCIGICTTHPDKYNLKPIKKEWYEDENQSRVVMFLNKEGNDDHLNILFSEEFVKKPKLKDFENKPYGWRLATNKEIDTLKINHN